MNDQELRNRTKAFAHACVRVADKLPKNSLGRYVADQIMRAAISVASNYRATCLAQSKASFISKLSIVLEEIDESYFWLEFIGDENLLGSEYLRSVLQEANELRAIFLASRKTAHAKGRR